MKTVTSAIRLDREFAGVLQTLRAEYEAEKPLPLLVNGLASGAGDAFLAEILREGLSLVKNAVVLVKNEKEGRRISELLSLSGLPACFYPKRDFNMHPVTASHDLERERLSVLRRLLSGGTVIVSTPDALLQYTMPTAVLASYSLSLSVGSEIPPASLAASLLSMGFSRVESVEGYGQFALRGGILDLFVPGEGYPVRMEFFGDEIDRMGYFDPQSQRVFSATEELLLLPAREVTTNEAAQKKMETAVLRLLKNADSETLRAHLEAERNAIREGLDLAFADKYMADIYETPATPFDYLALDGRFFAAVLGTKEIGEALHTASVTATSELDSLKEEGFVPKGASYAISETAFRSYLDRALAVHINSFSVGTGNMRSSGLFGFRSRHTVSYGDNLSLLTEDLKNYRTLGYKTMICVQSKTEAENLAACLKDAGFAPELSEECTLLSLPYGGLLLRRTAPVTGFELMQARVAVISTTNAGEKEKTPRLARRRILKKAGAGDRILSYSELRDGDYVVHDTHGIGQFCGMESMTVGGVTRDYVAIRYAGNDMIHIPADRIESVSRYIGARAEDGSVKLSKIGGTDWFRKKERARGAAKEIAKELIALYAERKRRPGFAFSPDGDLEKEFDAGFGYEETDPQLIAIGEIKGDMEKPYPMDRLLCGDVGFGKTEVALRAAFKAIAGGKQVALLVPTTILALQHYETALSRMRGFPVSVEMLSRFRTPSESAQILRRLRRGDIDLIIGTHALLGKNVAFRDLGLLIVDEEQRFGVTQKEKLKKMSTGVDVLTLTATPIPRTLNMAMSGIRDMSILDEAPTDRFPVQTYVMEHDDLTVEDAIRKELRRRGQVLYLYNRVDRIDLVAGSLQKRIPEARITFAHGQMEHEELEEIWQALVRGEIDVLVCTTIIETGVDLPNANTLIIEDADRMGLSQLHQIRGRVGRSGRQAYAYFTYRRGKLLSEVAEKRLAAIRDFAEFGAGFRIALRDLEIRGAGNLLGAEQHGHIDAVGYEMYVRLLNEAILSEKGEIAEAPFDAKIEVHFDAHIPEGYIASSARRLEMYKKISLIATKEDAYDVLDELYDRFGQPPRVTVRLLFIAAARATAARLRFPLVLENNGQLQIHQEKIDLSVWSELFSVKQGLSFSGGTRPYIVYRYPKGKDAAEEMAELLFLYEKTKNTAEDSPLAEKE